MKAPKWLVPIVGAAGTGLIGFALGYYAGKRNASVIIYTPSEPDEAEEAEMIEIEEEFVEEVKAMKQPIIVDKVILDAETKELIDAQRELKQKLLEKEIEAIREKDREILSRPVNNVFTMNTEELPPWDYEEELARRKPDEPYVIHKDEFMENELDFSQETLTFYEGDEIMTDAVDQPLWGWYDMMGTLKWGHGSEDPNVVYIRNETLHFEWEVLRHSGRYEIEVAGLSIEDAYEQNDLKHSNGLHKFRDF